MGALLLSKLLLAGATGFLALLALDLEPASADQTIEAETFTKPGAVTVVDGTQYSGGKALKIPNSVDQPSKSVTITERSDLVIRGRGGFDGTSYPSLRLKIDGDAKQQIEFQALGDYRYDVNLEPGTYTVQLRGVNAAAGRNLFIDYVKTVSDPLTPPDTTPPVITMDNGPGDTEDGSAVFNFHTNEPSDLLCQVTRPGDPDPTWNPEDGICNTDETHGTYTVDSAPAEDYIFWVRARDKSAARNETIERYPFSLGPTATLEEKIVFSGATYYSAVDLFSINPDGTGLTRITNTPSFQENNIEVSSNGKKIVFMGVDINGEAAGIYTMNADGTNVNQLTTFGFYPTWSPDGRNIAFVSYDTLQGKFGITVMSSNGSDRHAVYTPSGSPAIHQPYWSPDGTKISFLNESRNTGLACGADTDILSVDASGGNVETLLGVGCLRSYFGLSPDGSRLLLNGGLNGGNDGLFSNPNTGVFDPAFIRNNPHILGASWSPDGSKVAWNEGEIRIGSPTSMFGSSTIYSPPPGLDGPFVQGSPDWALLAQ